MMADRVAISFSGLPRLFFEQTWIRWQSIIKRYDADVFIHCWTDGKDQDDIFDRLVGIYDPKIIKFEQSRHFPLHEYQERIWPTVIPYNVFSAYASIHESMRLVNEYSKQNDIRYDHVIRARHDVLVDNLDLIPLDDRSVGVPDDPDKFVLKFKYRDQDLWGINDLLAYGSQDSMTVYADVINQISQLYHGEGVDMCSELLLTSHLIKSGMRIDFKPMRTRIIRR